MCYKSIFLEYIENLIVLIKFYFCLSTFSKKLTKMRTVFLRKLKWLLQNLI